MAEFYSARESNANLDPFVVFTDVSSLCGFSSANAYASRSLSKWEDVT
jgi:hypothetical protein